MAAHHSITVATAQHQKCVTAKVVCQQRAAGYETARQCHPTRWSGPIHNSGRLIGKRGVDNYLKVSEVAGPTW